MTRISSTFNIVQNPNKKNEWREGRLKVCVAISLTVNVHDVPDGDGGTKAAHL